MGSWKTLVHVCRKWRNIAFGSPRRLDLRLFCKAGTPVRDTLDVWPPLPIAIRSSGHRRWGMDNIIAALEHNDRISVIDFMDFPEFNQFEFPNAHDFDDPDFLLAVPTSQSNDVLAAMERPFPALIQLCLSFGYERLGVPVVSDSLLGGSAGRLQNLWLNHVPFPGLPTLLLSATQLVILHLGNPFWVHSTRCDGHRLLPVDQPRISHHRVRFPSTSLCPGKLTSTITDTHSSSRSH